MICDRVADHKVTVEYEVRDGVRTGRLAPFCWSCKRHVGVSTAARPDTKHSSLVRSLREQLREAKLGYQKTAGEIQRLSWELSEAQERVHQLEQQLEGRL